MNKARVKGMENEEYLRWISFVIPGSVRRGSFMGRRF